MKSFFPFIPFKFVTRVTNKQFLDKFDNGWKQNENDWFSGIIAV